MSKSKDLAQHPTTILSDRQVYLDYAASTPVSDQVAAAMQPWLQRPGNPSSVHRYGKQARAAIDQARQRLATALRCQTRELFFTSSGTVSNNLALLGSMRAIGHGHFITSAIEHASIVQSARALAAQSSYQQTVVSVQTNGIVSVDHVLQALTPETRLVSIMLGNNEIGTWQPIQQIVQAVKQQVPGILVHTDACQALAWWPELDLSAIGADMVSFSANKLYGPTGSGGLYVRPGVQLQPLWFGGGQEQALHPGTESVATIVGLAAAVEESQQLQQTETQRLTLLRQFCITRIEQLIPDTFFNGDRIHSMPHIVNLTIPGVDADILLAHLDQRGVALSLGSACAAGSLQPSHVLEALGLSRQHARSSIRMSFGRSTTKADVEYAIQQLVASVQILTNPVY